ncbi:MAG: hypothetical protein JW864_17890 [Spirochaetes bacterium]|nr:hypothetical protein [Spirochaetota bacterium]
MKTFRFIYFVFLVSLIFAVSCTTNVRDQEFVTDNAKFSIVFAGDSSEFKDKIRTTLIDKYKSKANIYIVSNDNLKNLDQQKYDAVVIMNTCLAGSPSYGDIESFIDSNDNKNKIILFVSANRTSWKYSYNGVDAITAASKSGDPQSIAQEISGRIDAAVAGK